MRLVAFLLVALALVALVIGGGLAVGGRMAWGAAGWYFPWNYTPDYRLRCGQQAVRQFEIDRAEEIALRLEADGHKDYAHLLRGESYFWQGRPYADVNQLSTAGPLLVKALGEFNKIRDQGDLLVEATTYLGQCYLYLKQPFEAELALQFVLSKQPDNVEAHRGLAVLYHDQGALGQALRHLQKVADLDPHDGRPLRLMGLIYKDLEQYSEAITSYEEALRRDLPAQNREQAPAAVRKELAECLVHQNQYDKALEVLQQFEPLPEDVPAVQALRGECLWGRERGQEARTVLDQALVNYPNSPELLRVRGKIHLDDGNYPKAVELFENALRLDRHDHICRYQLGQAYEKMGRKTEAEEQKRLLAQTHKDLEELSRLNREVFNSPWDLNKRLRLIELCEKLDKPDLAAMWRKAAAFCPPPAVPTKTGAEKIEEKKTGT
jgi:tetratricopeptide (TPR) repeat protein